MKLYLSAYTASSGVDSIIIIIYYYLLHFTSCGKKFHAVVCCTH